MRPLIVIPAARRDLIAQAGYFDAQGGAVRDDRFLKECGAGFERLSQFPESGALVRHKHPKIEGCRFILVPGFEKILIFYKPLPERIEIVRILHGARDIEEALN